MESVASRDLRNHTAEVLRRVESGVVVAITVHGRVVAEIHPPTDRRPRSWTRDEFVREVLPHQADAGLREELAASDQWTDELDEPWA